jgi:hypothetical protein
MVDARFHILRNPYQALTGAATQAGRVAWLLLCGLAAAQPQRPLQLHIQHRPPYTEVHPDGSVGGVLVEPVLTALQRAGIAHQWVQTPSRRQLLLIQNGDGWHCGVGWYRLPEREPLGKFSRPIYQDRPFMALARQDTAIKPGSTVAALLALPGRVLLVKEGYSYGPALDGLLAQHPDAVRRTTAESLQMVRMILADRADWMLITPDEAGPLLQQLGEEAAAVPLRPLSGVPPGTPRHLYCNRAVPDAMIDAVNRALPESR